MDNKMTWNRLATEIIADREESGRRKNIIIILLAVALIEWMILLGCWHKINRKEREL